MHLPAPMQLSGECVVQEDACSHAAFDLESTPYAPNGFLLFGLSLFTVDAPCKLQMQLQLTTNSERFFPNWFPGPE